MLHQAPPVPGVLPVTGVANLATAIAKIMSAIAEQRVVKRGENTFHHYKYASMQDILQALSPLMSAEGIVIMQSEVSRGMLDNGAAITVTYEFTVFHKSGEVWPQKMTQTASCNARANNGKFDDKAINKCHTAARKYFLLALFQIPTEDENDADRGDNDGGGRSPPRNARRERDQTREEAQAPPPREVTKQTPQEIPRPSGIKAAEWAGLYVEQINLCATIAELMAWRAANKATLDELQAKAAKLYERVEAVETARTDELAARA